MNYRHAFHAGNFADVHKHAVLTRILVHLGVGGFNRPVAVQSPRTGGITSLSRRQARRRSRRSRGIEILG